MNDKNGLTSLAEKQAAQKRAKAEREAEEKAERNKKLVPLIALIACNLIFLSLDGRAIQAVYVITQDYLLTAFTVIVSGGLALLWFDMFYPHGKKHNNAPQSKIAIWGAGLAILLSAVLAVADYLVSDGGKINTTLETGLWIFVIAATIMQGGMIGRFWMIDKHIEAEAKKEEARAEKTDQADEVGVLRAKLTGLRTVLTEVSGLREDFGVSAVEKVANLLGIPLPDMDGDGIPNYRDPVDNRKNNPIAPQNPNLNRSFASETGQTIRADEKTPQNPPTQAGQNQPRR